MVATLIISFLLVSAVCFIVFVAILRKELSRVPLPDGPSELTEMFLSQLESNRHRKILKRLKRGK